LLPPGIAHMVTLRRTLQCSGSGTPGSRSDRNIPSSEGVVVRFSYRMVPEVYQVFWAGMAAGEFINDAAIAAGSYRKQGARWLAAVGGVRPRRGRNLKGRCLTLAQREEIALGRARGDSIRAIAAIIGRSPSTVSRELRRNADGLGRYRATSAHALAYHRASRPKPAKLLTNLRLHSMDGGGPGQEVLPGADRRPVEGRLSRSAGAGGEH
jgi:transposase, IS30 family